MNSINADSTRSTILKKFNSSCVRCGYNELSVSLHIHHIDLDHNNNNIDNLIVLCANCHYSLHHKKWKISDIGINEPKINLNTLKRSTQLTKQKESDYLSKIKLLKKTIELQKQHIKTSNNNHSIELSNKKVLLDIYIEYVGLNSFDLREELILIGKVYNAYLYSVLNNIDGWSSYKPSYEMINIIKQKTNSQIEKLASENQIIYGDDKMRTYCYWCGKEITDKVYDCIWTYMNGQHRPFHLKCYGDKKQGVKQPTR